MRSAHAKLCLLQLQTPKTSLPSKSSSSLRVTGRSPAGKRYLHPDTLYSSHSAGTTHQKGTCGATEQASHGQSRDKFVPLSPREQKKRHPEDLPAELAPCVLFSFVTCSLMCAYMVVATSVCHLFKINHFACQGSRGNRNPAHKELIALEKILFPAKIYSPLQSNAPTQFASSFTSQWGEHLWWATRTAQEVSKVIQISTCYQNFEQTDKYHGLLQALKPTPGHTANTLTPSKPSCKWRDNPKGRNKAFFFFFLKQHTSNFGVATLGIAADTDVFIRYWCSIWYIWQQSGTPRF